MGTSKIYRVCGSTIMCYPLIFEVSDFYLYRDMALLIDDIKTDENAAMVLLVDDQAMIGEAVRRGLSNEENIDFHFCSDPHQAIAQAVRIKPTCGVPVGEGQNRTRTGVEASTAGISSKLVIISTLRH